MDDFLATWNWDAFLVVVVLGLLYMIGRLRRRVQLLEERLERIEAAGPPDIPPTSEIR